ncbi:hypothetical protein D3C73_1215780 [compost metagenome]
MPELHHYEIAFFNFYQHSIPKAIGLKSTAAGSTQGIIFDCYFIGIEQIANKTPPAPQRTVAFAFSVFYGRIANEE